MQSGGSGSLARHPKEDRSVRSIRHVLLSGVVVALTGAALTAASAGQAAASQGPRSAAALEQLMARLDTGVPGTAWAVDPAGHQVVISVDSSVRGARLARLVAAMAGTSGPRGATSHTHTRTP